MDKRFMVTVACSTLGLINANGFAMAETIGRLDCNVVGTASQDPVGDKDGHRIVTDDRHHATESNAFLWSTVIKPLL